jgi:catechol 2,3-dioxygenase-like lactoylglutathione lyase family enzyme
MLATKGRAIGEGEPMTSLAVLHGVDAVTVPVPDLDEGLEFYRDQLGHELVWRNDAVGQVGLRLPESQAELVLSTNLEYAMNWLVRSVSEAVDHRRGRWKGDHRTDSDPG